MGLGGSINWGDGAWGVSTVPASKYVRYTQEFPQDIYKPNYMTQEVECYTDNEKILLGVSYAAKNIMLIDGFMMFSKSVCGYATKHYIPQREKNITVLKMIDTIDDKIYINDRLYAFVVVRKGYRSGDEQFVITPLYCNRFHARKAMQVADKVVYCPRCKHVMGEEEIAKL